MSALNRGTEFLFFDVDKVKVKYQQKIFTQKKSFIGPNMRWIKKNPSPAFAVLMPKLKKNLKNFLISSLKPNAWTQKSTSKLKRQTTVFEDSNITCYFSFFSAQY